MANHLLLLLQKYHETSRRSPLEVGDVPTNCNCIRNIIYFSTENRENNYDRRAFIKKWLLLWLLSLFSGNVWFVLQEKKSYREKDRRNIFGQWLCAPQSQFHCYIWKPRVCRGKHDAWIRPPQKWIGDIQTRASQRGWILGQQQRNPASNRKNCYE